MLKSAGYKESVQRYLDDYANPPETLTPDSGR
jgi:hypothetical protein